VRSCTTLLSSWVIYHDRLKLHYDCVDPYSHFFKCESCGLINMQGVQKKAPKLHTSLQSCLVCSLVHFNLKVSKTDIEIGTYFLGMGPGIIFLDSHLLTSKCPRLCYMFVILALHYCQRVVVFSHRMYTFGRARLQLPKL
jgi:hypothetical protein